MRRKKMCKYNDINIYRGTVMKIENRLPKVIDENEQLYFDDIDDIFYGFNSYGVKAHCWYLQQWVETGLVGTLGLIVFLLWYLIKSINCLLKS